MAGIDELLERVGNEPWFRVRLTSRPWAALAGYDLDEAERERLAVALLTPAPVRQRLAPGWATERGA